MLNINLFWTVIRHKLWMKKERSCLKREWLYEQLVEAEVSTQLGAEKNEQSQDRQATAAVTVHIV